MKTVWQSEHVVVCSLKWGQPVEGQIAIEATTKLQWGQRVWGLPVDAQNGELNATQQTTKGEDVNGVVVISVTMEMT